MKPLHAEFAPRSGPSRQGWLVCAALAIAAVAVLAASQYAHVQMARRAEQWAAQRDAVQAAATPAAVPSQAPPAYADSAAELLAERSAVWQATLLALERTARVGVTPVSVEIQLRERSARVEVEFADYAVLLQYLEQLNAGGNGAEWSLQSAAQRGQAAQGAVPGAGVPGGGAAATAVLLRRW